MQLLGGVLQKNHPEKFRQVDEKVYVQEFLVAVTVTKKNRSFLLLLQLQKRNKAYSSV